MKLIKSKSKRTRYVFESTTYQNKSSFIKTKNNNLWDSLYKSKKGMELEYSVKAILALIVLVVMVGILILFVVQRAGGGANIIVTDVNNQGDDVLSQLGDFFGNKCDSGQTKCSMTGNLMECDDGKWEKTDEDCE